MRAITLTQPWATLIVLGAKRVETRGDRFPAPKVGETIAIHAAKGLAGLDGYDGLRGLPALRAICAQREFAAALTPVAHRAGAGQQLLTEPAAIDWGTVLPRGAVVAVARVAGTEPTAQVADQVRAGRVTGYGTVAMDEHAFGHYAPGRIAIFLEHVTPLLEPVPCSGALGLWEIPGHVAPQVRGELERAYEHAQAPYSDDPEPAVEAVRNPVAATVGAGAVRDRTHASESAAGSAAGGAA